MAIHQEHSLRDLDTRAGHAHSMRGPERAPSSQPWRPVSTEVGTAILLTSFEILGASCVIGIACVPGVYGEQCPDTGLCEWSRDEDNHAVAIQVCHQGAPIDRLSADPVETAHHEARLEGRDEVVAQDVASRYHADVAQLLPTREASRSREPRA